MEAQVALLATLADTASGVVSALAAVVLCFFTIVLARETKRLARATSQPLVTATFEPSPWAINHVNMIVENSGSGPAFNIKIETSPSIEEVSGGEFSNAGWSGISVLRPSQSVRSHVGLSKRFVDRKMHVDVSWQRHPTAKKRESWSYDLDLSTHMGKARLGPETPLFQIAEQVKHLREDWKWLATGQRKLKVDGFSSQDRQKERKEHEDRVKKFRSESEDP